MAKIVINILSRVGASDLTLSPDGISAIKDKFGVTLPSDYFTRDRRDDPMLLWLLESYPTEAEYMSDDAYEVEQLCLGDMFESESAGLRIVQVRDHWLIEDDGEGGEYVVTSDTPIEIV